MDGYRLQQTKLTQFPTQCLRHAPGSGCDPIEIARAIFAREVSPALKRPPRSGLDKNEPGLEHKMASAHPGFVDERPYINQALPAHHFAADHPIQRAAVTQLVGTLGHHAGSVHVLARQSAFRALLEPLRDPMLQVLDRVAADAKLDEVESQRFLPIETRSPGIRNR
jgi:hypothetical protein